MSNVISTRFVSPLKASGDGVSGGLSFGPDDRQHVGNGLEHIPGKLQSTKPTSPYETGVLSKASTPPYAWRFKE